MAVISCLLFHRMCLSHEISLPSGPLKCLRTKEAKNVARNKSRLCDNFNAESGCAGGAERGWGARNDFSLYMANGYCIP